MQEVVGRMDKTPDKSQMMETLVDPEISVILAELEDGEKGSTFLAEKLKISSDEIAKRLSPVIEYGFVGVKTNQYEHIYCVDKDKLDKFMESDDNFAGIVDGLTELDQFLN